MLGLDHLHGDLAVHTSEKMDDSTKFVLERFIEGSAHLIRRLLVEEDPAERRQEGPRRTALEAPVGIKTIKFAGLVRFQSYAQKRLFNISTRNVRPNRSIFTKLGFLD